MGSQWERRNNQSVRTVEIFRRENRAPQDDRLLKRRTLDSSERGGPPQKGGPCNRKSDPPLRSE